MAHTHLQMASLGFIALFSVVATDGLQAAPPPAPFMEAIALTAWLRVDDGRTNDVQVELVVNGKLERGRPDGTGRVDLVLPPDVVAVVRFIKPGHLTKEVTVDTHHVNDGRFNRKQRRLSFAVVLQAREDMDGQTYAGPVGAITFDDGGGCLAVDHDRRVVPESRQQFMTF